MESMLVHIVFLLKKKENEKLKENLEHLDFSLWAYNPYKKIYIIVNTKHFKTFLPDLYYI